MGKMYQLKIDWDKCNNCAICMRFINSFVLYLQRCERLLISEKNYKQKKFDIDRAIHNCEPGAIVFEKLKDENKG